MVLVEKSVIATWEVALTAEDPHTPQFYKLAEDRAERFVANERSQHFDESKIFQHALNTVMPLPLKEGNFVDRPMLEFLACVEDRLASRGLSLLAYDIRNKPFTPRVQFPDAYHSYLEERKRELTKALSISNGSQSHTENF